MSETILTDAERRALGYFARDAGRSWRRVLRTAWETGFYPAFTPQDERPTLQGVRNTIGPSGLARLPRQRAPL